MAHRNGQAHTRAMYEVGDPDLYTGDMRSQTGDPWETRNPGDRGHTRNPVRARQKRTRGAGYQHGSSRR